MVSVNNQRRPSVGTNVTPSMGVRRPSDGNVQPINNNMNDSTSNSDQIKSATSTSPGSAFLNGHFPIRSRSSSASSMQSSGSYLLQAELPGVYSQLEQNIPWSNSNIQQQITRINTDFATNEATSSKRRQSQSSPISANVDGSNVSSPTSAAAASLTRRDHITGHTHDRSRSTSFDGEVEPSAWTLDRVLAWLEDNSFSELKSQFIEKNLQGEQFFALSDIRNTKNIMESSDARHRLITAIRKIGDIRPKRQSLSNKDNQPDVQSPHPGSQLSSSNSINEQNTPTTPTMQSQPSPTEISKQKSLKLSTSVPELRNVNPKGPITSPVIGPRNSSLGWDKSNNLSNSISSTINSHNENPMQQSQHNFNIQSQSNVSSPSEDTISPLSPSSTRRIKGSTSVSSFKTARSVSPPKYIQVTFDNENFRVVYLNGREDPSTIKDVICSHLEIPQNEREYYTFHLTEIGQKEIGPTIDGEALIQKCKQADHRGSLKLLIKWRQHRIGGDYSRNNTPRSQQIAHPTALQPANGMMRRPPSRDGIRDNTRPLQNPQQSLITVPSGGVYTHPQNMYSKSQPHLPISQKHPSSSTAINSRNSSDYQHTLHAVTSEPDLTNRSLWQQPSRSGKEFTRHPIIQEAVFPEESDEPPLWPKITLSSQSKEDEEPFCAEKPKPSAQDAQNDDDNDDENSFWAEKPKSVKNKNTSNEESFSQNDDDNLPIDDVDEVDLLRKTNTENDDKVQKPKPLSYTSNDNEDEEDFWAQKPISSKSKSLSNDDAHNPNTSNSEQSTNSLVMRSYEAIDSAISLNSVNNKAHDNYENGSHINGPENNSSERIHSKSSAPTPTPQKQKRSSRPAGLARTVSLRRGVVDSWVVRPTAEDLVENLDQYFPGHDLDKPIVDANGQHPVNHEESQPIVQEKTGGKIQRGKSIRAAAREAHEREQREKKERSGTKRFIGVVNTIKAGQLLSRKPTTKLWDQKVVEEVPAHKKPYPPAASPGESVSAERKLSVRWARGELIGKGTFGKVFLAMNINSSEIMAVKQIELPKTKSDLLNERQQNLIKSFTDEMEILKDLDHEHIVQYIGFEKNNEAINIFLEYVNGGSIGTCLRIYGAFKEPVVKSFTRQIVLGLQYLHNKGILHRDIKADNILVNEEGCCKISDFGISKKSENHALAYYHNSNMTLQGTIFWMAPEVFTKGYSAKVDIWSLGCVVLEMFAGERPWSNLTDLAVMYKLGSEKEAPPIRDDIDMSSDARNFLDQCFIIEPNTRPTAEDLLNNHSFATEDLDFHFKEYISIPGNT